MVDCEEIAETEFSLVCQPDIVFCDPGDDVVLSCHLQPAISAASMEIKWHYKADLICHYKDRELTMSGGYESQVSLSLEDLHNGNVSLTLKGVRPPLRGIYICEIISKWQTKKDYVFLHVSSENFRLVAHPHTISAEPGEDVILPVCITPETNAVFMKIQWLKGRELIYEYKYGQGTANSAFENRVDFFTENLERGNLSLSLRNVQPSDSGDYTCMVFHDGSVTPADVRLQVTDIKYDFIERRSWCTEEFTRQFEHDLLQKKWEKTLRKALIDYNKGKKTTDVKDEIPLERDRKKEERQTRHGRRTRRARSVEEIVLRMRDEGSLERDRMQEERHFFSSHGSTTRMRSSAEAIPPLMRDEGSLERDRMQEERHFFSSHGSTTRMRSSAEAIPPLMGDDSPLERDRMAEERDADRRAHMQGRLHSLENMQREIHSTELSELSESATQQQENPTTMQELIQERIAGETRTQERRETRTSQPVTSSPAAAGETQTQERAQGRTQSTRRQEHKEGKCKIM